MRGKIMDHKPCACRAILPVVAALLVLPIAISVLVAVSALLVAMGDATGGVVVKYIALACGVVWVTGLIALVLLQGLHAACEAGRPRTPAFRRTTTTRTIATQCPSRVPLALPVRSLSPWQKGTGKASGTLC